ncbi:MAG TPA: hemolysin family protein [Alphaproteobacteria bacterium]|nr:hemolysin family protein [Alphaproteobacteria bacterium]
MNTQTARTLSAAAREAREAPDPSEPSETPQSQTSPGGFLSRLRHAVFPARRRNGGSLRHALEDYIESLEEDPGQAPTGPETSILSNALGLRGLCVRDVMVPRADIVGIDVTTPFTELLSFIAARPFSRYPVFREELDEIVGTIHIKDILTRIARNESPATADLVREVPIVSPALSVVELLGLMRETCKPMALVVDEYGGIDGLVTAGDITGSLVGEIDDEFHASAAPDIVARPDGSLVVDARVGLEAFEARAGRVFEEQACQSVDTLGGFVSALAGRVPARGESFTLDSGVTFEVVEADPRRIRRLRVRNLPG